MTDTRWQIQVELRAIPAPMTRAKVDAIYAAFTSLDVSRVEISGRLSDGVTRFSVVVDHPDRDKARDVGVSAIRAALHDVGDHTPNWIQRDELDELVDCSIQTTSPSRDLAPA
jgi:NADPH-dependent ferric siderophore reductase